MLRFHLAIPLCSSLSLAACATASESPAESKAPATEAVDQAAPAPAGGVGSIRADDPKLVDAAMAALTAAGSECGYLSQEKFGVCDKDRDGSVTLVLLDMKPRLFLISHILREPKMSCENAAPALNQINAQFDALKVICAENITFATQLTPGATGLTDEEFVAIANQFRTEIQSIIRAGMLAGLAVD